MCWIWRIAGQCSPPPPTGWGCTSCWAATQTSCQRDLGEPGLDKIKNSCINLSLAKHSRSFLRKRICTFLSEWPAVFWDAMGKENTIYALLSFSVKKPSLRWQRNEGEWFLVSGKFPREGECEYYVAVPWGKISFGICWWFDTHTHTYIYTYNTPGYFDKVWSDTQRVQSIFHNSISILTLFNNLFISWLLVGMHWVFHFKQP